MASSGNIPPEILDLMNHTIEVGDADEDMYSRKVGKNWRDVKCLLVPGTDIMSTPETITSNPRWVATCDDVDINSDNVIRIKGTTTLIDIKVIETYPDETGANMFQVVGLG